MSHYAYNYLNDSFLFDATLVGGHYNSIPENELRSELEKYRRHCLRELDEGLQQSISSDEKFRCMVAEGMSSLNSLKQAALYQEEVIISDPLFEITDFRNEYDTALSSHLGVEDRGTIDKHNVVSAVNYLKQLQPLVCGQYVKLYPISYELERDLEVPIFYSYHNYEDFLPAELLSAYKNSVDVRSVEAANGQLLVMKKLYPCRRINIMFNGLPNFGMGHVLQNVEVVDHVEDMVTLKATIPNDIPIDSKFNYWVSGCVNRTAYRHFNDFYRRLILSQKLNCMFSTDSEFEFRLLGATEANIQENAMK